MPMSAVAAGTPCYVLMEENRRIGPTVVPLASGLACTAIYGFSNKGPYDTFWANSQLALMPYPLVKGYLRNQVNEAGNGLKLVVLDAAGPFESPLHAASMEAVLDAQENRTPHVTAEYRLIFDQEANAYRVEDNPA